MIQIIFSIIVVVVMIKRTTRTEADLGLMAATWASAEFWAPLERRARAMLGALAGQPKAAATRLRSSNNKDDTG